MHRTNRINRRRLHAILPILYIPVMTIFLAFSVVEAQKNNREAAQRAFDRGYQYQTGKGIRKDLGRALEAYREAFTKDKSYADAYYNFALIAFYEFQRYDLAELGFKNYLQFHPNDAKTVHDLGVAYHKQGKFEEAIRQYRRALELKPDMAQAHYNLGNIYYHLKRPEMALQEWDKAIQLDPENETYINRRKRIKEIKRQKESVLSPDNVWWIMYGLAGVFVAYCIFYMFRKRR
ncbi:MAG: tetratricopeptide repeat protein [Candidatus Latescibacteria bacterium]|nr:tetratricopeptide repeat protein [Candidatus Latescibacterota bacterium]